MPPLATTDGAPDGSAWSLAPCAIVVVAAIASRRTVESLLLGALLGFALVEGTGFFGAFVASLLSVMKDDTIVWIVLVCGLFGSLIQVLALAGAGEALGDAFARVVRGRRGVLLATWLLGIVVFVDDYLNALTVGATMRRLADRFGVSRAMLAYVVDSTAAPVCVLVPMSTWALYTGGLLEENGVAAKGAGMSAYLAVIPWAVYAWVAIGMVPLVAVGLIPAVGAMRGEEAKARLAAEALSTAPPTETANGLGRVLTFVAPMTLLVGATVWLGGADDTRVLKAILLALGVAALLARWTTGIGWPPLLDATLEGFGRMVPALAIVVLSFVLKDANERLGLTPYVIDLFGPLMTKGLLPAAVFVSIAVVTFATGSFWGTFAVTLPVVIPLAQAAGVEPSLAVGAVVSAGAFGSHACFYGDATVLSSAACGVENMTHALTQAPYALAAAALTTAVYLVAGFLG